MFSPDGRYLYYADRKDDTDADGKTRRKVITRIWDRKKQAAAGEAAPGAAGDDQPAEGSSNDDDVIDAEYEVKD